MMQELLTSIWDNSWEWQKCHSFFYYFPLIYIDYLLKQIRLISRKGLTLLFGFDTIKG